MSTAKTLLIVGGVGVGAFVLYEIFKPGSTVLKKSTAPTQTANGNILSGLVGAAVGLFSSFRSPTGPAIYGSASGQAATPVPQSTYDANGGNLYYTNINGGGYSAGAAANYGYADTHPGTDLPDGVYGPPVPSTSGDVSGGDNGLVYA